MPLPAAEPGDIYLGEPEESVGSEQAFRRPWVIISRKALNGSRLLVAVPLTTNLDKADKYPSFCVRLPKEVIDYDSSYRRQEDAVALCQQIRAMDKERFGERIGRLTLAALLSVRVGVSFVLDI